MPRPLRVTLFFTDQETGWSETHYDLQSINLSQAAVRAFITLVPARIQMMASGPWLKYIRCSYDDTWRDSQVFFPPPGILGPYGYQNNRQWQGTYAAVAWTTALLRGVGGDLYRKQIYISGVPYPDPTDIGTPQTDPIFMAAFAAYKTILIQNYGFPIWRRDVQTNPLKQITAIGAVAPFPLTVPNHGFNQNPGTRTFITDFRYNAGTVAGSVRFTKPFYISSIPDANTVILANFPWNALYTFLQGHIQFQQKDVQAYSDVLIERFTHRKRGRPFDSPRGRSRSRTISTVR